MWVGSIRSLESLNRTEDRGRANLPSLSWDIHLLLLSDFDTPGFLAFRLRWGLATSALRILGPLDLDYIIAPAFRDLQLADSISWDFSSSITSWANWYNKFPSICIYICSWLCFSGELWLKHFQTLSWPLIHLLFPSPLFGLIPHILQNLLQVSGLLRSLPSYSDQCDSPCPSTTSLPMRRLRIHCHAASFHFSCRFWFPESVVEPEILHF